MGEGCNRAAVYNYRLDNWTFYDLPNVTSGCLSTVSSALSYNDVMDSSYQEMGGSYVSNEDDQDLHALFVAPEADAAGLSASRIYGLDLFTGGRLVKPLESEVSMPSFIEREIGRASCRERVCQYVEILGVAVSLKKKQ